MTSTLVKPKTNNRLKTRFTLKMRALYSSAYSEVWHDCEIYDISEDGACININQYLLPGDEVLLQIVTEHRRIYLKSEVKYTLCPRTGIKFKIKHEDIKEEIHNLVYKTFDEQIKRYKAIHY